MFHAFFYELVLVENLRISLVQTDLQWEAPEANRDHLERSLEPLAGKTDVIILPEMFPTAFSMNAEALAEEMDGPSMQWMENLSRRYQAVLTGSLIIRERGFFRNRLIWMEPDGQRHHYDKKHLFALAGEDRYEAGTDRLLVRWKGWSIMPLICYDLRFPVWSRNIFDYDLLFYIASWPKMRIQAWNTLLQARAIENQAFVAGVNRVGVDGQGYPYNGHTSLVNFDGSLLYRCVDQEDILTASLSRQKLLEYRARLPFLKDRDTFHLED